MRRLFFILLLGGLAVPQAFGFCGFYVARAGAELFNEASQVIVVRGQNRTVITMSNDFRGNAQEFAMVVPVPVVLQRDQIRIANQGIFDYLDAYSGPRLVEYHDENPCQPHYALETTSMAPMAENADIGQAQRGAGMDLGVRIEASYAVGEYDILILSATQAAGLKTWLTANGYSIPPQAEEVLEPYIRSNLKFFVVKVNMQEFSQGGFTKLRPLQISFDSERFMLPIRLGMANSTGWQDLIVYAFSDRGRVEPVNYPLAQIPTDQDIPNTLQPRFGEFYAALFKKAWERNEKRAVLLEYFWDISSSNYNHCDPCNTTPPSYANLNDAGVFWVTNGGYGADYNGNVFITRMHVRYNRELYPEDLMFQVTPGNGNFQGRYVMHHPATGDMNCDAGEAYLVELKQRQARERRNLAWLTGWAMGADTQNPNGTPGPNRDGMPIGGAANPNDNSPTDGPGGIEEYIPNLPVMDAPRVNAPWLSDAIRLGLVGALLSLMTGLFLWRRRRLLRARTARA